MRKLTPLLFFIIAIASCTDREKEQAEEARQDSIAQKATRDSIDRAKIVKDSIDTVNAIERAKKDSSTTVAIQELVLDEATCENIRNIIYADTVQDPIHYSLYLAKALECKNRTWNAANPGSEVVTVVSQQEDKILFNTIRVGTAEQIADAAKKVVGIVALVKGQGDPITTTAVGVVGTYAVDAYLDAAKSSNPLLIIMPTAIPSIALAKDALKITKGAVDKIKEFADKSKPVKVVVDGAEVVLAGPVALAKVSVGVAKGVATPVIQIGKGIKNGGSAVNKWRKKFF